jgi:hypothetical protein
VRLLEVTGLVLGLANLLLAQDKKSPVPPEADIKAAEKGLQQAYKQEFAVQDRVAKRAAARKLLTDAPSLKNEAERYALLQDISTLSLQAMDPWTALKAIELTGKYFEVNLNDLKTGIVNAAKKLATNPADAAIVAEFCLTLWERSMDETEFDAAAEWGKMAEQIAKASKDAPLIQSAKDMSAEAIQVKKERERALQAETSLGAGGDDPAAHTDLGIYLCFIKGEWEKGLPHLSKGIEGSLRELSVKDLLKDTDAEAKLGISIAWRLAAEKEKSPILRKRLLLRSSYWQDEALKGADPVAKRKIQKKTAPNITLIKANYSIGKSSVDVTTKIQEVLDNDPKAPFIADYYVAGPATPGDPRGLTIEYQQGKERPKNSVGDWEAITIPFISPKGTPLPEATFRFAIVRAHYCAGLLSVDVTDLARTAIPNVSTIYSTALANSDPFGGKHKTLVVEFDYHGRRFIRKSLQEEMVTLIP